MKKILALMIAALMVLSMVSAFADGDAATATAVAADTQVSVNGLLAGDVVNFYQVLAWNQDSGAYEVTTGFAALKDDTTNFPADEDDSTGRDAEIVAAVIAGLTQAQANAIAALASGATKVNAEPITVAENATTATYTLPKTNDVVNPSALGLYMGLITAGSPKYVYNPVFIGADYNSVDSGTPSVAVTESYSGTGAIAKKQEITVTKETSDADSARASAIDSYRGQEVTFYVDTLIPVFLDSYTQPRFDIEDDIVTTGIDLNVDSIEIKLGDGASDPVYAKTASEGKQAYDDTKFTVTTDAENDKYTVKFNSTWLGNNVTAVPVHITYKGTVINPSECNLNEDYNDVSIIYSNGPTDEAAALRDETNHYTFSIGAKVFGLSGDEGKTYELIKVAADKNGNPIYEKTLVEDWKTEVERHPLAGATFGLYTKNSSGALVPYAFGQYSDKATYPDGATFTTDTDGVISFYGLAAGEYYIKEISAPSGYVKDDRAAKVVIAATYSEKTVAASVMTDPVTKKEIKVEGYSVKTLDSYTVTVDDVSIYEGNKYVEANNPVVSTYTYVNDGPRTSTITEASTPNDSELVNTPGVELPSTGGMGTTILYVGGSILVLLAVILLVTKRRMNANDD